MPKPGQPPRVGLHGTRDVLQTVGEGLMEHVLSLSYGKDSLACLGAIEELGWPLDRIVHAEVWATDTIPADLPPMVEFKKKADAIIKKRWGIDVEHFRAVKTFQDCFYSTVSSRAKDCYVGGIRGWPIRLGQYCLRDLKLPALKKANKNNGIYYLGIAEDEPDRFHNLTDTRKSPLVEAGWTEVMCRKWCEKNGLLSPIYTTGTRGGCWFCHNQGVDQLRILRKDYPDYWALMLKWDKDSPVTFHADGHTIHDYDRRFWLEDFGAVRKGRKFRWRDVLEQVNIWDCMGCEQ